MMRAGHHLPLAFLVSTALNMAWNATGAPQRSPLEYLGSVAILATWWALWCDFRVHSRHLCERCAASTPLDPGRAVQRWRLALLCFHRYGVKAIAILAVTAMIISLFLPQPWPRWADYADIGAQAIVAVLAIMFWQHGKLQAWCPWCRWGDEGEHEEVPDPDPAVAL